MDITSISSYVNIIIVGICLCVGYVVKNIYTNDKINRFIPLMMAVLGLILSVCSNINKINLEIILTGLLSGLLSTGCYEAFKSIINKK